MKRSRGRKCMYKDCKHIQGQSKCKFHSFPQTVGAASEWLLRAGVQSLTPKRLRPHHVLCSCHFPGGRGEGPTDFFEEDECDHEVQSPQPKRSLIEDEVIAGRACPSVAATPRTQIAVEGLLALTVDEVNEDRECASTLAPTPRTRSAVEGLLSLCNEQVAHSESKGGTSVNQDSDHDFAAPKAAPPKSRSTRFPKFSPRGSLWMLHSKASLETPRKRLRKHLDFLSQVDSSSEDDMNARALDGEDLDLGVTPFSTEEAIPPPPCTNAVSTQSHHPPEDGEICIDSPDPVRDNVCTSGQEKERSTRSIGIQCERAFLSYGRCRQLPEEEFRFYTGVTQPIFETVYQYLGGHEVCSKLKYEYNRTTPQREQFQGELHPKDKLFLTLLRLRRGVPFNDLKILFHISKSQASKIFYSWIRLMRLEFGKLEGAMFLSAANQPKEKIPKCFRLFDNLRVIIDTCHFKMQKPKHLQQNCYTFSEYKNYNSLKFLVGISCFGGLSFISEGYEGSISDRKIVEDSGFMDNLQAGDAVMGDKGFDLADLADERGVDLIIPSFMHGRPAFTGRELMWSRAIAESRIHVERFIGRLNEFRIIRYVIPNTVLPVASDMVKVCAYLVNFQTPFIRWGNNEDGDE